LQKPIPFRLVFRNESSGVVFTQALQHKLEAELPPWRLVLPGGVF
jgi:hypothetical protein